MKKTIGIGIIGLQQGEALMAVNDDRTTRLRVAAVCSSTPGLAAQVAERYDINHYTADHVDMLPMPAIDAAAIFSPAREHYDHVLAALVANRHVLCTQPIADTLKGALDLAAEADKQGRKALFWHAERWHPKWEAAHALATSGDLGELHVLDAVVALPPPPKAGQGRRRAAVPPDPIFDGLSRAIDMLHWFGGDITEVTAIGQGDPPATITVTMRFQSGALGRALVLSGSASTPFTLNLYGSKGSLVNETVVLDSVHGRPPMTFYTAGPAGSSNEPLLRCARHFEECLVKNSRPGVDHWDAVRTVAVCEAVRASLREGRRVCVPPAGREQEFVEAQASSDQG